MCALGAGASAYDGAGSGDGTGPDQAGRRPGRLARGGAFAVTSGETGCLASRLTSRGRWQPRRQAGPADSDDAAGGRR